MFDEHLDDSEDDTNEVELLLPRRETKQQAELRRSNARKRSRVALGCACNILNGTLGPGMLVLPLAFRRTGLGYGIALLVADWALSYLALRLLLDACAHTPAELVKSARRPQATQPAGSKEWVAFPRARPANSRRGAPLPSRRKVCPKRAALLLRLAGASRASYSSPAPTGRRCPCSSIGRSCSISTARAYPTSSSSVARSTTCSTTTRRARCPCGGAQPEP